jgi:predicted NUDIX family NTP pyrophosphohydrolase
VARRSAGIVLYRSAPALEVLLVHPGGPFFAKKDAGVWSIPKGEYEDGDDPLACALREFEEETGARVEAASAVELGTIVQRGGKRVTAWAIEGDLDAAATHSNTFVMEWPPRSGRQQEFPEIDRAEWFALGTARSKVVKGQMPLLDALEQKLSLR